MEADTNGRHLFVLSAHHRNTTADDLSAMTHLLVDSSVTYIPENACFASTQLCQVTFAERLPLSPDGSWRRNQELFIGSRAFSINESLQELSLPSFVTTIGDDAISNCHALTKVTLSEGLRHIGSRSFYNCISLKEIGVPFTVEFIGHSAFAHCRSLARVKLPEGLKKVSHAMFLSCVSLPELLLPSTVEEIIAAAFLGCRALEYIPFPRGLKRIERESFRCCVSLFAVSISTTTEDIAKRAFSSCTNLTAFHIPAGSTVKFHERSFEDCCSLMNIAIPESMSLDDDAAVEAKTFQGCSRLEGAFGQGIEEGLQRRFLDLPLHKLCYDPLARTEGVDHMLATLVSTAAAKKIDHLGMSPFHILTSSANLREDIFKYILSGLDYLEAYQCCWQKDYQGKTCIDYLLEQPRRSNEVSNSMIQMILKKSVQDRLLGWGLESWRLEMSGTIDRICTNEDADANKELVDELYQKMSKYEEHENISMLELALWKKELQSIKRLENLQLSLDRLSFRIRCGTAVAIPHVMAFL